MPRRKNQVEPVNTAPTNEEANPKRKAAPSGPENKPPSKRQRRDASKPKAEKTVQWHSHTLRYVQNLVGQPGFNPFGHYSHACLLQLPLQPGVLTPQSIHRHFEPFPWSTTYPVPLVTQRIQDQLVKIEPMKQLVKAKKTHMTILSNLRINYKRKQTVYRRVCRKQKDLFPNAVFKVAEQLERDPDRWFLDAMGYDYYFTGGSLAVIHSESFSLIVNTVGDEMNAVEMVPFDVAGDIFKVDTARTERYDLGAEKGPIYEVSWHESSDACGVDASAQFDSTIGSSIKIALRRKHFVDIMWTKTGHDAMKIKSFKVHSDVPFISSCLLLRGSGWLLCTSDLEKHVKIWDCNRGRLLNSLKLQNEDQAYDNWTCVRAIKSRFLICLDRSWIRLIKTSNTKIKMVRETPISCWVWICEKASCLEVYPEEGILFIGTTHKLLVIRMVERNEKDPPDFEQIVTFTHNLKHYPTMISYNSDSNQNINVWISSHLAGDSKLCSFSKVPPKSFASKHIPRKLHTIQESYHLARTKGKCIYPATAVKRRIQCFHSGLAMIVDSDHYHLLLQNSFGDIFHQRITPDPEASNAAEIPDLLNSWMLKLNSFDTSTAIITDFKNIRGFKKIFANENLKPDLGKHSSNTAFKRRARWQRTTEQLHQYKDMLASEILAAWGYRPDVTRERRLSTDEPMNASERISNWLETTADITVVARAPQDCIVKEDNVVQIGSDHEMELEEDGVEIVGQTLLPQTPMADVTIVSTWGPSSGASGTPRSAVKSARKRYVQGF